MLGNAARRTCVSRAQGNHISTWFAYAGRPAAHRLWHRFWLWRGTAPRGPPGAAAEADIPENRRAD
jgi:hypothetical protein